jgi:hypothetical protein
VRGAVRKTQWSDRGNRSGDGCVYSGAVAPIRLVPAPGVAARQGTDLRRLRLVQVPLEPGEQLPDLARAPQLGHRIVDRVVFQVDELWKVAKFGSRHSGL